MKWFRHIGMLLSLLLVPLAAPAAEFDMDEYLYGHVSDAYEWHITTINGKPVSIPLPVIVRSRTTGWHCFSSHHLEEGSYAGFRIAGKGEDHEGKIVEDTPSGPVRPVDISITKNVLGLMVNSLILVLLVLFGTRWYRKHDAREEGHVDHDRAHVP